MGDCAPLLFPWGCRPSSCQAIRKTATLCRGPLRPLWRGCSQKPEWKTEQRSFSPWRLTQVLTLMPAGFTHTIPSRSLVGLGHVGMHEQRVAAYRSIQPAATICLDTSARIWGCGSSSCLAVSPSLITCPASLICKFRSTPCRQGGCQQLGPRGGRHATRPAQPCGHSPHG
jgi:hypothetical protein